MKGPVVAAQNDVRGSCFRVSEVGRRIGIINLGLFSRHARAQHADPVHLSELHQGRSFNDLLQGRTWSISKGAFPRSTAALMIPCRPTMMTGIRTTASEVSSAPLPYLKWSTSNCKLRCFFAEATPDLDNNCVGLYQSWHGSTCHLHEHIVPL